MWILQVLHTTALWIHHPV